jgi:4-carboxymuconolactone decarboxylase
VADDAYEVGAKVRRAVLGDAHVDRAEAKITSYNREFQDFITRFGWNEIWGRPHFDHRTRRILIIGTNLAMGRWEELRMHVRAALEHGGMSIDDIKEIFLQQTIYCGFPIANTGFHHLAEIVEELKARGVKIRGLEE